jgi:hypothetical protein
MLLRCLALNQASWRCQSHLIGYVKIGEKYFAVSNLDVESSDCEGNRLTIPTLFNCVRFERANQEFVVMRKFCFTPW